MVLLQLMLAKFRPHPVKESSRPGHQAHETVALGQGNSLRTYSDRCIYVQNGSARGQVRVQVQRDTHSIRP